jgi:hypothetical protein
VLIVPRVEAPSSVNLGSVPLSIVFFWFVVYEVWIAVHSRLVIWEMLFSTRIENPVVVLLPVLSENKGVAEAPIVAPQIGVIEIP